MSGRFANFEMVTPNRSISSHLDFLYMSCTLHARTQHGTRSPVLFGHLIWISTIYLLISDFVVVKAESANIYCEKRNRMRRGGRRPNPRPYVPPPQPLLQDIDLELELLKRKREIIEQQQQMLNNDCLSGNRFGEISHMYEDHGSCGPSTSGGNKRPPVWELESPPKRFATGNTSSPNKSFPPQLRAEVKKPNSQTGFQPRSSGFQSRSGFKPHPNPSVAKKKNFKPTKVSKPSAATPPNKLNSYSRAERRNLVTEALNSESLVLRADRPTSNQLNGRLELALGHIIKDIRAKFPEYEEQFKNNVGRAIKQALRDRLRACMMGKQVTGLNDTIKIYRESFPPETDKDLLLNSLEVQMGTDFVPIESDNPQEFFIKNLGRLMTKKMEEMFNKLGEIYSNDKPNEKKIDTTINKNSDVIEIKDKNDDDVQLIPDEKVNNEIYDISDIDTETVSKTEQGEHGEKYKKIINMEEYKRLDSLMTGMLPFMLKKMTPLILKTMKLDVMYRKTFGGIKQDLRRKLMADGGKQWTPKNQQNIPKAVQKTDVIILDSTQNKQEGNKDEHSKKIYQPLPYFVKILGRPSLPKRKCMQTFFDNYNPKSIKKHRTVHNILFVGFADKQDFDNILAANGTVIGRNTLTIKVSERSNQPLPPSNVEDNPKPIIINDELDEQITELLSSIKKSEGLLDDDVIMGETKQEKVILNEAFIIDNETELGQKVKVPENGVTDESVQENGTTEHSIEEKQGETATEDVANADVTENSDTNTEKQDETSNIVNENNFPIEVETDDNPEKEKGNVEEHQEIKDNDKNTTEIKSEMKDTVLNSEVPSTPTRSSARLAAMI